MIAEAIEEQSLSFLLKVDKNGSKKYFYSNFFFFKITPHCFEESESDDAQIILFYSPLGESGAIRGQIVIYWFVEEFVKGDFLALYHDSEDKFLFTYHPTEISGYVKTGVSPSKERYSMDFTYAEQCTGNNPTVA